MAIGEKARANDRSRTRYGTQESTPLRYTRSAIHKGASTLASADCRQNKTTVPFKAGDSSNVNTHLQHSNLHGVGAVVKEEKNQSMATSIQTSCST